MQMRVRQQKAKKIKNKAWLRGTRFVLQKLQQQLCPSMQKIRLNLYPSRQWCNLLRFWSEHHNQRRRAGTGLCKSRPARTHKQEREGRCVCVCVWTGQAFTTKGRTEAASWNALRGTFKRLKPLQGVTLKVKKCFLKKRCLLSLIKLSQPNEIWYNCTSESTDDVLLSELRAPQRTNAHAQIRDYRKQSSKRINPNPPKHHPPPTPWL